MVQWGFLPRISRVTHDLSFHPRQDSGLLLPMTYVRLSSNSQNNDFSIEHKIILAYTGTSTSYSTQFVLDNILIDKPRDL